MANSKSRRLSLLTSAEPPMNSISCPILSAVHPLRRRLRERVDQQHGGDEQPLRNAFAGKEVR